MVEQYVSLVPRLRPIRIDLFLTRDGLLVRGVIIAVFQLPHLYSFLIVVMKDYNWRRESWLSSGSSGTKRSQREAIIRRSIFGEEVSKSKRLEER